MFVVVPATKDVGRRPRAPRWHATLAGDNRFPRTPALPGPPSNRDTGESGTLVRQEGDAPSSSTWQADALLLSYCLIKYGFYRVPMLCKIIRKLTAGILLLPHTTRSAV